MKKRNGSQIMLTTMLCGSLLLPSSSAHALFGADEATLEQQFAQIAIAEKELEAILQSIEVLPLGDELAAIFEQMFGVQAIVEDVMAYEPPSELVEEHDIINPLEHKRLTAERKQYLIEIDAEIAELEKEIALNPDQMNTLAAASEKISEPRSSIVATQAQFLGDQAALEQDRRRIAVELLRNKREDIQKQIVTAQKSSSEAALKCIREKRSVDEC